MPLKLLLEILLGLALAISAVTDLAARRIPDWVTWPTVALALGARLLVEGVGDPGTGLVSGGLGVALASALFALLAWRGQGFGWGDVKLMAAVGACLGYPLVLTALALISLVGALQALVTVVWHGAAWETVSAIVGRWAKWLKLEVGAAPARRTIPYGVAIALGALWAMWWDQRGVETP